MFKLFSIRKKFGSRNRPGLYGTDHTFVRSTIYLFGFIPLFYYDVDGNSY